MPRLTPADLGVIAACLDDALSLRMGDDSTVAHAAGDIAHELRISLPAASDLAYAAFRARVAG